MLAVGVIIWLGSEFMFFSGLFAAFFTIRAHNMPLWPPAGTFPHGTQLDTLPGAVFTFVLLASSPTFQLGVWAQERGELQEGPKLDHHELPPRCRVPREPGLRVEDPSLPARTNAYGSLFYIMSGLHGLHVLLGLVAMIALLGRLAGSIKGGDPGETRSFRPSAITGTSSISSGSGSSAPCSCCLTDPARLAAPAVDLRASRFSELRRGVPARGSPRRRIREHRRDRLRTRPASRARRARRPQVSSRRAARCSWRTAPPVTGSPPRAAPGAEPPRCRRGDRRPVALGGWMPLAEPTAEPERKPPKFNPPQILEIVKYVTSLAPPGQPGHPVQPGHLACERGGRFQSVRAQLRPLPHDHRRRRRARGRDPGAAAARRHQDAWSGRRSAPAPATCRDSGPARCHRLRSSTSSATW